MVFNQRFTEGWTPIARINPASYNTEQNTARFAVGAYRRFVVILMVGAITSTGTLDIDIEQSNAASGGTTKNVDGKSITQLTQASGDSNKIVAIEIRSEELDVNNGFAWLNVELTPLTAASICGVLVLAGEARQKPVSVANWDEIKD